MGRTFRNVSISSPSSEGGGNDLKQTVIESAHMVSISSPSSEGGGLKVSNA